jgi:16S rRNA C967 or C1407 C5-methylase (RsmB/RsmF family)
MSSDYHKFVSKFAKENPGPNLFNRVNEVWKQQSKKLTHSNNKTTNSNISVAMLKQLFPDINNVDFSKLKITKEGVYSITKPDQAEYISKLIAKYFGGKTDNMVITDGTSNVGGNVINFAQHFKSVNAVEMSDDTCKILKNNVNEYSLKNVKIICNDYTKAILELKQDIVFMDPPWGGINYKQHKTVYLFLSDIGIGKIVNKLKDSVKMVVLKVPYNFDINRFNEEQRAFKTVHMHRIANYIILMMH